MKNILFTMSLSGSIIVLLYFLLHPFFKRFFTVQYRSFFLTIAMFFYLLPISLFKYDLLNPLLEHSSFIKELYYQIRPQNIDKTFLVISNEKNIQISSKTKYSMILTIICCIISLILIFAFISYYKKYKKTCLTTSTIRVPPIWDQQLEDLKQKMRIKKRVLLIGSAYCTSPITIGIFSPVIIFPAPFENIDNETFYFMLKHELTHIKHHDLLFKYLSLFTLAVHWFNPIVYLWFHELCYISEAICDNVVTSELTEQQKRKYSNTILLYAYKSNTIFSINLSSDAAILKRRILEMKKSPKKQFIPFFIVTFLFFTFGTITSFAYTPPVQIQYESEQHGEIFEITSESNVWESPEIAPYHLFYTDTYGHIYPIEELSAEPRFCSHKFSNKVTITEHTKNRNGSCDLVYREGTQCEYCQYIKTGSIIKTTHYNTCPH